MLRCGRRPGKELEIFQDRTDIAWGQNWKQRIEETLDVVTLLVPVITPGFFGSQACRGEVARFLDRERALGRSDLILPVYYVSAREMDDPALREAVRSPQSWRRGSSRTGGSCGSSRLRPRGAPGGCAAGDADGDTFWQPARPPANPGSAGQQAP